MKRKLLTKLMLRETVRSCWKIALGILFFMGVLFYLSRGDTEVSNYMAGWVLLLIAFGFEFGTMVAAVRYIQLGFASGANRRTIVGALVRAETIITQVTALILTTYECGLALFLNVHTDLLRSGGLHLSWGPQLFTLEWLLYFVVISLVWLLTLVWYGLTMRLQKMVLAGLAGGTMSLVIIGFLGSNPLHWLLPRVVGQSTGRLAILLGVGLAICLLLEWAAQRVWQHVDLQQMVAKE